MEPEFITYQKFNEAALANELAEQLADHCIENYIEEESFTFNSSFALNDPMSMYYAVKIKSGDFETANLLLKQDESANTAEVEADYYLFSFTDAELLEVIAKADEWSPFDFVLARKILAERGKIVTDEAISAIQEERIEELKMAEPSQQTWIILGYIIAVSGTVMPFFISIIGLFVGWHLWHYKKTLPNGDRVFDYNETDRKHGQRIFYIGTIVFSLGAIFYFYSAFKTNY